MWERNSLWRELDFSFCRTFTCTKTDITHYRKVKTPKSTIGPLKDLILPWKLSSN